jgi:putative ABC transport system permease protein
MFRNYLRAAWRDLWKSKFFSAINTIGLAIGLATSLLLICYVLDELRFDRHHLKADRIYRINNEIKFGENYFDIAQSPGMMGPAFAASFPQVEQYTRLQWYGDILVRKGTVNIRESRVMFADSTLFEVFTLPVVAGDPHTALKEPHSLVITASMAKKYFGRTDVAGQSLIINNGEAYKITAVIKDMPLQSHFVADFFIPMRQNPNSRDESAWLSNNHNTYLLLKKGVDPRKLEPELNRLLSARVDPLLQNVIHTSLADFNKQGNFVRCSLMPMLSIHLHSARTAELSANSSITYIYIFSAIALFILLIACVNFMNLSTARSSKRAKEVGVRKVLGSLRKDLISQFLMASVLVSFLALLIALAGVAVLLPWFNQLAEKDIHLSVLFRPGMLGIIVALTLIVGLLAGSYPAFFLSAFKPIDVLKGKLATGFKGSWMRNSMVVFQFAVSIMLIIGTIVIYNQLTYIRNKDIGFTREQVLVIQNTAVLGAKAAGFKKELSSIAGVKDVTMTGYLPVSGFRSNNSFFLSPALDQQSAVSMQIWPVDEDYVPTFNMQLAAGRNFSPEMPTDSNALIINEAAARFMGGGDLLNKKLYSIADVKTRQIKEYTIVGVVKNFNFNSLRDQVTPLALHIGLENNSVAVRLATPDPALLSQIKDKWNAFAPGEPFDHYFADEAFNNLYKTEQRTGKIIVTFATLAILIACLGLFGLSTYAAQQRTREIGIRKVLGASVANITGMLSKEFLKLVLIAAVIAFPLAGWAMYSWLQDFAYRVSIGWWVFAAAGVAAVLIALLTISFQAIKAGLADPVKSLRTE